MVARFSWQQSVWRSLGLGTSRLCGAGASEQLLCSKQALIEMQRQLRLGCERAASQRWTLGCGLAMLLCSCVPNTCLLTLCALLNGTDECGWSGPHRRQLGDQQSSRCFGIVLAVDTAQPPPGRPLQPRVD